LEKLLIISIFLLILIATILSTLMLIKTQRCFWQSLIDNLKKLPLPICIVSCNSNDIVDYNKYFYNLIVGKENTDDNRKIKLIDIFENFEDYLMIKHLSKDKNSDINNKTIKILTIDGIKHVNVKFKHFKIGFRKNIVLLFNNITEEIKSFKYLGVFTLIAENTHDGILISQKNNNSKLPKIIYSNSRLTEITGYKREEILNKPINAIFELNVDEQVLNTIKEKITAMEYSELKHKYVAKDGKEYWLCTNIIPITNDDIKRSLKNVLNNDNSLVNYINTLNNGDVFIVLHQSSLEEN